MCPAPNPFAVPASDEFTHAIGELGYPEKKICFKPPFSKGNTRFSCTLSRIRSPESSALWAPRCHDHDNGRDCGILGTAVSFPELMVMEFADGMEHTVDAYCRNGEPLMGFVKTRRPCAAGSPCIRDGRPPRSVGVWSRNLPAIGN